MLDILRLFLATGQEHNYLVAFQNIKSLQVGQASLMVQLGWVLEPMPDLAWLLIMKDPVQGSKNKMSRLSKLAT